MHTTVLYMIKGIHTPYSEKKKILKVVDFGFKKKVYKDYLYLILAYGGTLQRVKHQFQRFLGSFSRVQGEFHLIKKVVTGSYEKFWTWNLGCKGCLTFQGSSSKF